MHIHVIVSNVGAAHRSLPTLSLGVIGRLCSVIATLSEHRLTILHQFLVYTNAYICLVSVGIGITLPRRVL